MTNFYSIIWLIFIHKSFVHPILYENILYENFYLNEKSTCLVAVELFQYLLPWVANSCFIYPLVQSLVPETVYMMLLKSDYRQRDGFLEE